MGSQALGIQEELFPDLIRTVGQLPPKIQSRHGIGNVASPQQTLISRYRNGVG